MNYKPWQNLHRTAQLNAHFQPILFDLQLTGHCRSYRPQVLQIPYGGKKVFGLLPTHNRKLALLLLPRFITVNLKQKDSLWLPRCRQVSHQT